MWRWASYLAQQRWQDGHGTVGDGAGDAAEGGQRSRELPVQSSQVPAAGVKAIGMVRGRRSQNLPLAPTAFEVGLRAT